MDSLNLGILAHVDAGKTSLSERLLFNAGVIGSLGRVDEGSTQTDSLALERERGITIKAAVVSFRIGERTVNLIDTPGHPDFIAEVERSLGVLDGAVLVVSAVEGVQPQTRILLRALRRLAIPTIIFVNKIDRGGARPDAVLADISARLTPSVIAMGSVHDAGSRAARWVPLDAADPPYAARLTDLLTAHDDALLAAYVEGASTLSGRCLVAALAAQTRRALVHPVYFGSAMTGAGIDGLTDGLTALLPSARGPVSGPAAGLVFKVERGAAAEKVAYVRLFTGTLRARDTLNYGVGQQGRITAISVFDGGPAVPSPIARAGQIAKVTGLAGIRVGDSIGCSGPSGRGGQDPARFFAPPTLQAVVTPVRERDRSALHVALVQLAEQDPLIGLHEDDLRRQTTVWLYGEVQREVIEATLAGEYGIDAQFSPTRPLCVERVIQAGAAAEFMDAAENPFKATVGLRVQPGAPGSGVRFGLEVELGSMPLAFIKAVEETVRQTLREGLSGWQVIDCAVFLTQCGYVPPPPSGWSKFSSSAGDFRGLTPLVLMTALQRARTVVCEPLSTVRLDIPAESLRPVLTALGRLGASGQAPVPASAGFAVESELPAARVHALRRQLPGLTGGEGTLEAEFARYQPAREPVPVRPRTDHNPLDRQAYLLRVQRAVAGRLPGGPS